MEQAPGRTFVRQTGSARCGPAVRRSRARTRRPQENHFPQLPNPSTSRWHEKRLRYHESFRETRHDDNTRTHTLRGEAAPAGALPLDPDEATPPTLMGCSSAEAWASRCSSTIRTARSRTSGENRLERPIDPILPSNEVSEKPGTVHALVVKLAYTRQHRERRARRRPWLNASPLRSISQ